MSEQNPDFRARSPWSALTNVRAVQVAAVPHPISQKMAVPGSKSFTNRALVLAGLAEGHSTLHGILRSDDSYWCLEALRQLGRSVVVTDDTVKISGGGGQWSQSEQPLYIGAAGTTARFLPGALAVATDGKWEVDGSTRLRERPIKPLLDSLQKLGAQFEFMDAPDRLPLTVYGTGLTGGETEISGRVSSQFLSGLLIASPYAKQPVVIHVTDGIVQQAYVQITVQMMKSFGVSVSHDRDMTRFFVSPSHYKGQDMALEADASTASYFFALAAVTGGDVEVTNLSSTSTQPDVGFVDILERMGCKVFKQQNTIRVVGPLQLEGGFTVSMRELSDQALTLAAIAPYASGPIRVTGIAHIRNHESNRIRAVVENLARLSIKCEEHEDGFTVHPGTPSAGTLLSYDDHRVAMAFSVLAARCGDVEILDPGCVSKTCPNFFDLLSGVGVSLGFFESR